MCSASVSEVDWLVGLAAPPQTRLYHIGTCSLAILYVMLYDEERRGDDRKKSEIRRFIV